jgi:prevent-host-death family protein
MDGIWGVDMKTNLLDLDCIDEPVGAPEFSEALTRVVSGQRTVIVRRGGDEIAAVIPLEYLELLREQLAQEEAERLAGQLDWDRLVKASPPPQAWFDGDEPKPF